MLNSRQPAPSHLLEKTMQMEDISTDGIFFYLRQIEEPDKLLLNDQGGYYLLLYKATLWKTGTPDDSLLQIAIRQYKQDEQQTQCIQARIEQSISCLYRDLSDSTLPTNEQILKGYRLNDTLKAGLYKLRRIAYSREQDYPQASVMADSDRQLILKMKDTLFCFSTNQLYLQIIDRIQGHDRYIQNYPQLMKELVDSPKYQSLSYYALESLLNTSLQRKDFRQAAVHLQQLSSQHHGRNKVPHYLLLCGRTRAALSQIDPAQYYYRQAAASPSSFIAAEASARLFSLANEKEYPEQVFYTKQKENTIRDNILSNISIGIRERGFNQFKLRNELYQLHLQQQQRELRMLRIVTALLSIGFIVFFFCQREKRKRLLQRNQLLYKEAEVSGLREKKIRLGNKGAKLREALFRRMPFFHKLPSLHADNNRDEPGTSRRIVVTDAEWAEVTSIVGDAFDDFVVRLRRAYPQLGDREIGFRYPIKINVNIQGLSDIYCVNKTAITKRKYRIKTDKLGVTDENISLDSFLKIFQLSPQDS